MKAVYWVHQSNGTINRGGTKAQAERLQRKIGGRIEKY